MPSVFTLFADLKFDVGAFEKSLKSQETLLKGAQSELTKTEQKSKSLGDTSATVGRRYEKLNEQLGANNTRLREAANAYLSGDINAKKFASTLAQVERQTTSLTSRIKDANARVAEIGATGKSHFQNQIAGSFPGVGALNATLSDIESRFTQVSSSALASLGPVGAGLSALAGPAAIAAGAIAGVGVVAVGTGEKLFEMAKQSSEAVKKFGGFEYLTGFNAKATSTFAYALNFMGKELSDVQRPLTFFNKLMYEAGQGSVKAKETLAKLNVTQFGNLEQAFDAAAKKIELTTDSVDRLGLATSAFGTRGGADIAKAIHTMGGDFDAFQKQAEDLGVTLSQDDINAAKEFSHTYEKGMYQAKIASEKFALAYADDIGGALQDVSGFLAENKDEWEKWGTVIGIVAKDVVKGLERVTTFIEDHQTAIRATLAIATLGQSEAAIFAAQQWSKPIAEQYNRRPLKSSYGGSAFSGGSDIGDGSPDDSPTTGIAGVHREAARASKAVAANTQAAEDAARKWAEHIKDALKTVKDAYVSTSDNPYVKIFSQAEASIERVRAATLGLGRDITNAAVGRITAQAAGQVFGQQINDRVAAYNLRSEARQFRAGKLDDPNNIDGLRKRIDDQFGLIGAQSSLGWSSTLYDITGGKMQAIVDKYKTAKDDLVAQKVIALTQGADPSKLTSGQRDIAAAAYDHEANRIANQEAEAKQWRLDVITELKAISAAGGTVRIINEAPDRAMVNRQPTKADTERRYGNPYRD